MITAITDASSRNPQTAPAERSSTLFSPPIYHCQFARHGSSTTRSEFWDPPLLVSAFSSRINIHKMAVASKQDGKNKRPRPSGTGRDGDEARPKPQHDQPRAAPSFVSTLQHEETDFPRGGGTSLTALEVKQTRAEGRREAEAEAAQGVCGIALDPDVADGRASRE